MEGKPRHAKSYGLVLTLLFVAFLFGPLIGWMAGWHSTKEAIRSVEKRTAAPVPEVSLTIDGIREFPAEIDAYWNDFFGFRPLFVGIHGLMRLGFKANSVQPTGKDVLIGKDGWLFSRNQQDVVSQVQGLAQFEDGEVDRWIQALRSCDRWCRDRGIVFVFVVVPNKHTVYPEFLPDWVRVDERPTQTDTLLGALGQTDIPVLDLRPVMLDAKSAESAPLFYRTDTHWNRLGAFKAYEAIADDLERRGLVLNRILATDLEAKLSPSSPGKDLAGLLGVVSFVKETNKVEVSVSRNRPAGAPDEPDPDRVARAVVFGDSFSNNLLFYLRRTFSDLHVYRHGRGLDFTALVQRDAPDVVILEVVERFLNNETIPKRFNLNTRKSLRSQRRAEIAEDGPKTP